MTISRLDEIEARLKSGECCAAECEALRLALELAAALRDIERRSKNLHANTYLRSQGYTDVG